MLYTQLALLSAKRDDLDVNVYFSIDVRSTRNDVALFQNLYMGVAMYAPSAALETGIMYGNSKLFYLLEIW